VLFSSVALTVLFHFRQPLTTVIGRVENRTGQMLLYSMTIQFEERDLATFHGKRYADDRRLVPMGIPFTRIRTVEGLRKEDVLA